MFGVGSLECDPADLTAPGLQALALRLSMC